MLRGSDVVILTETEAHELYWFLHELPYPAPPTVVALRTELRDFLNRSEVEAKNTTV